MLDLFKPQQGALGSQVPYWGFVDDDVVLTVDGQFLFFSEVTPAGIDGRAPAELDPVTQAWQKLLGSLDPPHRAFIVFDRPGVDPDLDRFEGDTIAMLAQRKRLAFVAESVRQMRVFLVVAFQPGMRSHVHQEQKGWQATYFGRWLKGSRQQHLSFYIRDVVDRMLAECRTRHRELLSLVEDRTPVRPVRGDEVASFLFRVVNQGQGDWVPMKRPMRYGLNWRIAGETVAFERRNMSVGDNVVGLYSMALPPPRSAANSLGELYALPWDFTAVLEWRSVEKTAAMARIRAVQRHANTQRFSFWSAIQGTEGTEMALDDASSSAAVTQLYRAALELDTHGVAYGDCNLTIAVAAVDPSALDQVGALIQRVFVQQDGKAVKETFGQAAVWFQRMPGQRPQPLARPVFLSSGQAAALAPLFGGSAGYQTSSHLRKPCLTQFKTRWSTSYGYDLFGGKDVAHTAVFGATGSGKSFALNFLLLQSLQYNPRVMILDLGGSYRWITKFLGGRYIEMQVKEEDAPEPDGSPYEEPPDPGDVRVSAARRQLTAVAGLKPFALPESDRSILFLSRWVERLLQIGGHPVTAEERNDLRERVTDTYAYPVASRTLGTLVRTLKPNLRPVLARWVGDGPYATTFDGPPDDELDLNADWTVIDLAGATEHPDWCAAALFFLFERFRLVIDDNAIVDQLKLLVVDEAWRYLADPAVLTALTEAAKTWRKRNAGLVLATQSVVDVTKDAEARQLIESIPTKLFLANPDFPRSAAEQLQLTEAEYETIKNLTAKREMFLYRSTEREVLQLDVDPETYWLATSDPVESKLREKMVDRYGLSAALVRLAAGQTEVDDVGRMEVLA